MAARTGLLCTSTLVRAGFYPRGGGEVHAEVQPWAAAGPLVLDSRGALVGLRGISGAGRLKGDVARRQRDAAQERLWETRRLEAEWEVVDVPAASPGSFLLLEALFENGRMALGVLGERRVRAELVGDRAARRLMGLLDSEGAVDPHLADQLAVPLALSGQGGRLTTREVTSHLETVASVLQAFGVGARTWGRRGGPGGLEVDRC
jgi:RNA 3'-terminal phosphate cyclase (ATP)